MLEWLIVSSLQFVIPFIAGLGTAILPDKKYAISLYFIQYQTASKLQICLET